MAEVRTLSGRECLDEFNIEEAEFGELTHLIRDPSDELLEAPENQAIHDEPELEIARDAWLWENKIRDKTSKEAPPFLNLTSRNTEISLLKRCLNSSSLRISWKK